MGLVDKIKESGKKLALAGVLGSSLYLSGCLTTPQEAGRLFIKPIFTGDFDEWNKQGQMSQQGNNNQNSSSQGNGKGNNQNNNVQSRQLVQEDSNYKAGTPFGDLHIVSCNYIKDFNGDGTICYPNEYVGIKNTFSSNERITISLRSNKVFNSLRAEILNSNGKRVDESGVLKDVYGLSVSYNLNEDELVKIREQRPDGKIPDDAVLTLVQGNYRIIWYSNNNLVAMKDFEVGS